MMATSCGGSQEPSNRKGSDAIIGKEIHGRGLLRMDCAIPGEKYNPPRRKRILVTVLSTSDPRSSTSIWTSRLSLIRRDQPRWLIQGNSQRTDIWEERGAYWLIRNSPTALPNMCSSENKRGVF